MKTVIINQNSWHYRWLEKFNFLPKHNDICSYTRALINLTLATLLVMSVLIFITMSFGNFLVWLLVIILTKTLIEPDAMAMLAGTVTSLGLLGFICYLISKATKALPVVPEDIKSMWGSLRDKVCYKIEYKE